eukprot:11576015-Alexandrium_andersonii.AAC.1
MFHEVQAQPSRWASQSGCSELRRVQLGGKPALAKAASQAARPWAAVAWPQGCNHLGAETRNAPRWTPAAARLS